MEHSDKSPLSNLLSDAREIARQIAVPDEIFGRFDRIEKLFLAQNNPTVDIAIVGSPNVGKSSLINQLLGRSLLPTSVLPDDAVVRIQSSEDPTREGFSVTGELTNWQTIEDFSKDMLVLADVPVLFLLNDNWLRQHRFCLLEMPPLDVGDEAVETALMPFTLAADCLLLMTDASAPMRRNEVKLLNTCAQQNIPTVVVINKVDRLLPDEVVGMVDYVHKFTQACDANIPVISFSDRTPNTPEDIQTLRDTVVASVASFDLPEVRRQRARYVLTKMLDAITLKINTTLESPMSRAQSADIRERQHRVDTQNLEWQRIKQKLNARRRKVDATLTSQLQSNHASLLDGLLYELENTDDFRSWWQRDFTARLAQSMQQTAEQVTMAINQQAIADIEWLQAEAHKQFSFPLEGLEQPNAKVNVIPTPPKSRVVSDDNMLNIVSRIGVAAATILTRALSTRIGYRNAEVAASVITGLATEQLILRSRSQERENVRDELSATIKQVERAYISSSTQQLEDSYSQIVADLQHQQSRWKQTQAAEIQAAIRQKDGYSEAELQQLLVRIEQLKTHVETMA